MSKEAQALRAVAPASLAKSLSQESSINFEGMHPHSSNQVAQWRTQRKRNRREMTRLSRATKERKRRTAAIHTHTTLSALN
jgi:hypothetical protein